MGNDEVVCRWGEVRRSGGPTVVVHVLCGFEA